MRYGNRVKHFMDKGFHGISEEIIFLLRRNPMKNPSSYLKMRILGAVENTRGKTCRERIKKTAKLTFIDEEGNRRRFTWRTISTWYYRYQKDGVTGVAPKDRSDKGKTRKISPELLMEAINQVLIIVGGFHTVLPIRLMLAHFLWQPTQPSL